MRLFDFGTPLYKGVLTITSNHVRMSITGGVNNLYIFLSILPRSIEIMFIRYYEICINDFRELTKYTASLS